MRDKSFKNMLAAFLWQEINRLIHLDYPFLFDKIICLQFDSSASIKRLWTFFRPQSSLFEILARMQGEENPLKVCELSRVANCQPAPKISQQGCQLREKD